MSNEELVAAIQAGQAELMPQLWENVEKLIAWRANRFLSAISATGLCHGVEIGDLINSSYFAVLAAIKTYEPSQSKFSSWLLQYLQTAFAEASGYRTEKQRSDPLRYAWSLDTPLDDEDGDAIGDLYADSAATIPFENVDEAMYRNQLHQVLDESITQLPAVQAEILRRHYWDQQTLEDIGAEIGKSTERVRQLEGRAIRMLQTQPFRESLDTFLERQTSYYLRVGPQEFQRTHTSATEKIVLLRERIREERKNTLCQLKNG